jgi:signal transduction histidine kinase
LSADRLGLSRALATSWAFSPLVYLALVPLLVYSIWARVDATEPQLPLWQTFLIAVWSVLLGSVAFAAFSPRLRALDSPRAALRALLLWFLAGAGTVVGLVSGRAMAGLSPPLLIAGPVLVIVITILGMGVATYGMAVFSTRREQLREAEARQLRMRRLQEDASTFAREQRSDLANAIDDIVTPELVRLRNQAAELEEETSVTAIERLQREVSTYSADVVRSMSHELAGRAGSDADEARASSTRRSLLSELAHVLLSARITPALIGVMALALFLAQFRTACAPELALALGVFALLMFGFGLLGRLNPLRRRGVSVGWLVVGALVSYLVFRQMLAIEAERCNWGASSVTFSVGVVVAASTMLALAAVIEASREMRSAIDEAGRVNEGIADTTRLLQRDGVVTRDQVSQLLHGPVQGRLAAVAMALQMHLAARRHGRQPPVAALREQVMTLLDEASMEVHGILARTETGSEGSPENTIAMIIREQQQWRGLVDITYEVEESALEAIADDPALSVLVGECIDEAITNASRHGHARNVRLRLLLDSQRRGRLVLEVDDDGRGPVDDSRAGYGLTRIEMLGGEWSLEPGTNAGARLVVRIPRGEIRATKPATAPSP